MMIYSFVEETRLSFPFSFLSFSFRVLAMYVLPAILPRNSSIITETIYSVVCISIIVFSCRCKATYFGALRCFIPYEFLRGVGQLCRVEVM